jgi:hypothetical protein
MDRVVMEIVETEGVYVRDLQQVIEVSETKKKQLKGVHII